jgi:hypothetical protein
LKKDEFLKTKFGDYLHFQTQAKNLKMQVLKLLKMKTYLTKIIHDKNQNQSKRCFDFIEEATGESFEGILNYKIRRIFV